MRSKIGYEQIHIKFVHFGNYASPRSFLHSKSRSKHCNVYSDRDNCSQESKDNFSKEFQQETQHKEMTYGVPSLPLPKSL